MVDAVVSVVVQRLSDLLIEQVVFLHGVREEVEWLKNKLEWMQCFLKDAELKQGGDYRIRKWISDVRDVAYDAEDVIDDFVLKVILEEKVEGTTRRVGFKASFKKFFCICSDQESYIQKRAILYRIGKDIGALKNRLDEVQKNQELFKINIGCDVGEGSSQSNKRLKQLRRESPYDDNEDVVGFKEDAELLISKLLEGVPHRFVISIVGMGGLGKTTLARKLYNSRSLKDKFMCYAWVSISKEYNIQLLLQKLVKSFKIPTTEEQWKMLNDEETLEEHLRKYLDGRPYLVVIDDVWDTNAWKILSKTFPDNKNGSRVIITTRDNTVAEFSDERIYAHKLPFLKDEESWDLFCKKAFPNYDNMGTRDETNRCPPNLEAMARDMVTKCRGLPLAIAVLGALLSKKHPDEWTQVQEHLWQYVKDGLVHVSLILTLSFNNLPHHLRSCFLYLGLFPEDCDIKVEKLLRLWIAEGFIQPSGEALEDFAAKYLNELIDRNLVQVSRRTWKRIVTCRVHDLLRDLAIEKSKELNFLDIYDGSGGSSLSPNCRRLGCHCPFARFVSSNPSNLNLPLRTILSIDIGGEDIELEHFKLLCTKFRLARVVHFSSYFSANSFVNSRKIIDSLDLLGEIHLRYFQLADNAQSMPLSIPPIGNLGALQTLDFGNSCRLIKLPDEICNAKKLRHLIGSFWWPFPVKNLTNLRTLKMVVVDDLMDFDPVDLINLSKLYVTVSNLIARGFTLDSIGGLERLRTFLFRWKGEPKYFPILQPLSHCQQLLQLKILGGIIEKLPPEMHEFLPNLKFLFLDATKMKEDPMPVLEKFRNLTILNLEYYRGKKLACNSGGFPLLEILQFIDCGDLEELHVDEGGMPMLRGLKVDPYVRIPERLRSIPRPPKNCDFGDFDDWPY